MVNVNNYGVQGTNYTTGTNNQKKTQVPSNNTAPSQTRSTDQYSTGNMQSGNVPSVGAWDKMSAYFKNVMNTPQNLSKFKAFEQAVKNNPEGYLQPGSVDMGKVKDLQKKLNYLGMNLTINGQFGNATEQAVIRFKNSVGINDGYMDKTGKMAVTAVVTPKMWGLLNAQVSNKMNPSSNVVGSSYVTPVTQDELQWAKQLTQKIQQYGYKPNEAERQRYSNIYQRNQVNTQQTTSAPSSQEMNWAKQLAQKIQNGYRPNAQEKAAYQDIFNRNKESQANKPDKNGITPNEMSWAQNLMNKVKGGYSPSPDEQIKYNEILQKSTGQKPNTGNMQVQTNQPVQSNKPVTQQELQWAQQLETRVTQGYNPTNQERAKYEDIYKRSQGQPQTQQTQNTQQTYNKTGPLSQDEVQWAQDLESKVNSQGYKPSDQEMQIYENIFKRSQQQKPVTQNNPQLPSPTTQNQTQTQDSEQQIDLPNGLSQQDVNWALELENKTKNGYSPTQSEIAKYNEIANKLNGAQTSDNNTQNNVTATNTPETSSSNTDEEFVYNQATINSFKSAFPGTNFLGRAIPYLPSNAAKQVAQQYGFGSVSELQQAIGAGSDGKFGPETFFRLTKYLNQQSTSNTNTPQTTSTNVNQNGVTQNELDWAVNLQNKFSQGYKPTQQEQDKYTEIFNRYQSSGQNIISDQPQNTQAPTNPSLETTSSSGAPTQEEVTWAANMQTRVGSGYKPTQQEVDQYTDIYNRYQASGNQVSSGTQPTNTNIPQVQNVNQPTNNGGPTVGINADSQDPEIQWALQMLDKVQQGYQPTQQEMSQYEQIIAKNQQF